MTSLAGKQENIAAQWLGSSEMRGLPFLSLQVWNIFPILLLLQSSADLQRSSQQKLFQGLLGDADGGKAGWRDLRLNNFLRLVFTSGFTLP